MKPSERGAALLSVLLLVAILAVMAATALDRLRLGMRLSGNAAAVDQSRAYGMAAELIALRRLGATLQQDPSRTTLQGDWEGREVNVPIDAGEARATLTDAGNCFNLNALVNGRPDEGFATAPERVAQFARLMQLLGVPPADAQAVAAATADWIDTDTVPQPGGGEDERYQARTPRYRTANTLMVDRSELRAVAGVTPELYTRLRPFLCALPVTELSININTLSPAKAALVAMLAPGLDLDRAARAVAQRPATGWPDLSAFTGQPALAGVSVEGLRTATAWFGLRIRVLLADSEFEEDALIDARQRPAKLARRQFGEPT